MNKTLVLYVFHEYNDRVDYFIKNAIFYDESIDFVVISNKKDCEFYVPEYVKKVFRDNIGYDFGGWSDALLTDDLYKKYNHFIFVNSSVMGPFLPKNYNRRWTDIYLSGLKDNVKLFGSTINCIDDPLHKSHVQSYIFSMDKETLDFLISCDIFSTINYAPTFHDAIWQKEVLMSRRLIERGWNIGSLHSYYQNVDFTFSNKAPSDYAISFINDIMYEHYRGSMWNEYELVFIKGNRCPAFRPH